MSEQTRAEYDAKLADLNRRIQELEDERDGLQMLPEDRDYYDSKMSPELRELTRIAVAYFAKTNETLADLAYREAENRGFFKVTQGGGEEVKLRIVLPD